MAFDFSTLPKVRTHANLGNLGDINQDASNALADAHNILIDFATAASDFYNDAVASNAPSEVSSALQSSYNDARQLLTDHTALMNAFYAQTGLQGLNGLSNLHQVGRMRGLGQWQVLAPLLGAALRQVFWTSVWVYIASIVGRIADSFKSNTDAAQAKFKTRGEYYLAWKQAIDSGQTPPSPPNDLESGGGDMTTYLLIGASALVAVMLLMKK